MTTTLKNPISCGEHFQWGVRKGIEWKKPKEENEKFMENKAKRGIILCSPQEPCDQIPCSRQEQCHQTQSTLDKEITLPSNNILHSLPPPTPTESMTRSQQPMSHIMCTRNKNNTLGRNTMQDNKPLNMETFVWPKLNPSLSLREKEEDFLAIKGLKLPVRPKKRLECIQNAIHGPRRKLGIRGGLSPISSSLLTSPSQGVGDFARADLHSSCLANFVEGEICGG